jgi:hypothetical protein
LTIRYLHAMSNSSPTKAPAAQLIKDDAMQPIEEVFEIVRAKHPFAAEAVL